MAQIPEHLIDRIRESSDIVELISRYLPLKKQGRNYKTLCPFHTEKTPSFTVSQEKQIFYCFGCGEGGNVFNFLMKHEKISFIEAVKKLAEETGVELPSYREAGTQTSEYDRLYRANEFAAIFYHDLLNRHRGEIGNYLKDRGLEEKTINLFKLGFVPESWDTLVKEVARKKLNRDSFQKIGLILQSEKDPTRHYDRFRNRLIFPIQNLSGRTVAFGGRTLSSEANTPKYLNSPESPIYKKSQVLYGLFHSRDWIRKEEYATFVEGYMDFLQLFQHDIKNVAATSGTALTDEHAKLIRRYATKIYLCYDADNAGITAAVRGGQVLFQNNLDVRILILPEGEDPDSFVQEHGKSEFYRLLEDADDYFNFRLTHLLGSSSPDDISAQTIAVNEMIEAIAAHPDPLKRNLYVNRLSEKFRLQEQTLFDQVRKKQSIIQRRERRFSETQGDQPVEQKFTGLIGAWSAEKDVLILLLNYYDEVKEILFNILEPDEFLNEGFRKIYARVRQEPEKTGSEHLHNILSDPENEQISRLLTGDMLSDIEHPDKYLGDCLERIKIARHQNEVEQLRLRLKEISPDSPEYPQILQSINEELRQAREIRKQFSSEQ